MLSNWFSLQNGCHGYNAETLPNVSQFGATQTRVC